jgi:hypothetical protein
MRKQNAAADLRGGLVHDEIDKEAGAVHEWRVSQLTRLGLARSVAEIVADSVDWHEIAKLVRQGCPAALAVAIVA